MKLHSQKKYILPSLLILVSLLAALPYIILGENARLLIHDNLDSNLVWVKMLIDNDLCFASPNTVLDQVFEGLSLASVYPYYDIPLLIMKTFGVFAGYIINKVLMAVLAFWGMFLLIRKYITRSNNEYLISIGVSLLFAFLPFWSFTLSVAGLPFILYAFLNIYRNDRHWTNWLIIVLYGFSSSLVLTGLFLFIVFILYYIFEYIKHRKWNWGFIMALGVLGISYLISHYPLIYEFLFGEGFVSHRVEFKKSIPTFSEAFYTAKSMFGHGQYHATSLHQYIIYPALAALLLPAFYKGKKKPYLSILIFIAVTSLIYGFVNHPILSSLFEPIQKVLPIQLHRFYFLHPVFWYVLLAMSFTIAKNNYKGTKWVIMALLICQSIIVVRSHELKANGDSPTYSEIYDKEAFDKVAVSIGLPQDQYRVMCVGFHPAIAQFNGFYTLGAYFPNYPLEYKHAFREIIKDEIARNESLESYFNNWGSRCYAYSSELEMYNYINNHPSPISKLDYNFDKFIEMGGKYILSSSQIDCNNNPRLSLVSISKGKYWNIHLYEVLESSHI